MFPAQPSAHIAAHITPNKCFCSHSYKVGPELPFWQTGILSMPLPSPATDSSSPLWLCLPLLLERQCFWRNHLQHLRYNYWSLTSQQFILEGTWMTHSKQFLILIWLDQGHTQELKRQKKVAARHSTCLSFSTRRTNKSSVFGITSVSTQSHLKHYSLNVTSPSICQNQTMPWPVLNSTCTS